MIVLGCLVIYLIGWLILRQVNQLLAVTLTSAFVITQKDLEFSDRNEQEVKDRMDEFLKEFENTPSLKELKRHHTIFSILLLVLMVLAVLFLFVSMVS